MVKQRAKTIEENTLFTPLSFNVYTVEVFATFIPSYQKVIYALLFVMCREFVIDIGRSSL